MHNRPGAIPYQTMRDMIRAGYVEGASEDHVQPSSLDLTLTDEVYRMRGSYLPRPGEPIRDIIRRGSLYRASLEYPLECGGMYLIKLRESLALPRTIHASVSNKSSSGRIDLRTRTIGDGLARFDSIPAGYTGTIWIEVTPKSFPVKIYAGDRVNQMRFFHGDARLNTLEHQFAYDQHHFLRDRAGMPVPAVNDITTNGVLMTIDLMGEAAGADGAIIGWRSHPGSRNVLDTRRFDHDPYDFFEPIRKPAKDELTLTPGSFYILNTKENIVVPPEFAAEMANYDPTMGEFRSHFAGFFDPGFGWHEDETLRGAAAVLEVEAFGHESVLRDGQPICLMTYERMLSVPEKIYGADVKSNYTAQIGPRLAKWFRQPDATTRHPGDISAPSKPKPHVVTMSEPALPEIEPTLQPWDDIERIDLG
ncbi:2'-deoxycytidine 5'-triphosphate deaminase [Candidatus Uhrbacteria bacterium UHB]|nr:2'-deoxycytidine 5'-triphosphate deaminase [Candidatus Uhrbacteria bacterium UHB]RIL01033.1 MAG: 2'-deoxycytidine 5'-triphosphate deaminase [Candidatus Uhrbacteria bacterium]